MSLYSSIRKALICGSIEHSIKQNKPIKIIKINHDLWSIIPTEYLGPILFDKYRKCIFGSYYNPITKCNYCKLSIIIDIVAKLRNEGFVIVGDTLDIK